MTMIYVLGYNEDYPSGGLNDTIAIVDNSAGDKVDAEGFLSLAVLAQILNQRSNKADILEVLHLQANGMPGRVEHWNQYCRFNPKPLLPCAEITTEDVTTYHRHSKDWSIDAPLIA